MQYLCILRAHNVHIGIHGRRPVGRDASRDGDKGDRAGRGRPRKAAGDGEEEDGEPRYVSLRVPKSEYDKLKDLRGRMEKKPDYSWVGSLALGAFVGLAAGLALERLTRSDDGDNGE